MTQPKLPPITAQEIEKRILDWAERMRNENAQAMADLRSEILERLEQLRREILTEAERARAEVKVYMQMRRDEDKAEAGEPVVELVNLTR